MSKNYSISRRNSKRKIITQLSMRWEMPQVKIETLAIKRTKSTITIAILINTAMRKLMMV